MPRKLSPWTAHVKRLIIALALISLALVWFGSRQADPALAQSQPSSYRNFEAPQVHPLAITPDGTRLLAVNTPNNSLSVFHLTGRTLTLMGEIPVGLEPVSVAVRNDREVWVANWLSDSVSVVDLKTWNVTRTIDVGDEPTDIVFAGLQTQQAFVCVSGLRRIKVYDPAVTFANPLVLTIRGKQPRALSRDPNGARVFVSIFESGNQTTVVPAGVVAANGGPPEPHPAMATSLPAAPEVSLIVKWNGTSWNDERNDGRWTPFIPYTLADVDLVVLDASSSVTSVSREVRTIGTHIGNAVFDPTANQLFVVNDEAHNNVRFEPNIRGRFLSTQVSAIGLSNSTITPFDLNSHIDYGVPGGSDSERANSLAIPGDIARAANGTLYVAATGSAKVGVLNSSGAVTERINVGQGPTGLALNQNRNLLYVLNRFDESISIVDITTRAQIAVLPIGFNPEPDTVRNGRRFLYDATLSAHGEVACASCHPGGHRDGLVWDLGDPQGQMQQVFTPLPAPFTSNFHPMKGPMMVQSLRGIIGTNFSTEPLHWRGDRAAFENFNGAFVSLLGSGRELNATELAAFTAFIRTLTYPPNPNENFDRTVPNSATGASALHGSQIFASEGFDRGVVQCTGCHSFQGLNSFNNIGTNRAIVPGNLIAESQDLKAPHLRGLYQKVGLQRAPGEQLTGFGFAHDGNFDSIFSFLHSPNFTFQNDAQRRDLEAFMMAFDTGTAPTVGLQMTVNADNRSSAEVLDRIDLLVRQSTSTVFPGGTSQPNCNLVVKGIYGGAQRAFLHTGNGMFRTDKLGEASVPLLALLDSVHAGAELTFTGVPAGAGLRMSIDRDQNGILNGDEPRQPNALDAAQFFVWQHYLDFLNRNPDQAGFDYWTSRITQCGSDTRCIHESRIGVSAAFFIELEFQDTGYYVNRFYKASFDRQPTFVEFTGDRSKVIGGSNLEAKKQAFADEWVQRASFIQAYPNSMSNTEFVNKVFAMAGLAGAAYEAQRQQEIAQMNAGRSRALVLRDVIEIPDFKNIPDPSNPRYGELKQISQYNPAFVLMQYFGYLQRNKDQNGYNFWLDILNNRDANNYHGMVCSFLTSAEYQLRFSPSVTRSNADCGQ